MHGNTALNGLAEAMDIEAQEIGRRDLSSRSRRTGWLKHHRFGGVIEIVLPRYPRNPTMGEISAHFNLGDSERCE